MPDELVVSAVKEAVRLSRAGQQDAAFARYQQLFDSAEFAAAPIGDRRQALKLMVTAKGLPEPLSEAGVAAFQSAWRSLRQLVDAENRPEDHDLLGQTHLKLGDPAGAKAVFEAGLAVAHQFNDSEWAGILLKRISFL